MTTRARFRPANRSSQIISQGSAVTSTRRPAVRSERLQFQHVIRVRSIRPATHGVPRLSKLLGTQTFSKGVTSVGEEIPLSLAISCQLFALPVERLASAFKSSSGSRVKLTPPLAGVLEAGGAFAASSSISLNSSNRLLAL